MGCFSCHAAVANNVTILTNQQFAATYQHTIDTGRGPGTVIMVTAGGAMVIVAGGEVIAAAGTAACADSNCANEVQTLLQKLAESGGRVPVPAGQINANIMAELQAATANEHALIRATDGMRYLVQLAGKSFQGITLPGGSFPADAVRLIAHTHPGQGVVSLRPSFYDNQILLELNQTFSLIINEAGEVLRWRPIPND